jgi:hypothetical protein
MPTMAAVVRWLQGLAHWQIAREAVRPTHDMASRAENRGLSTWPGWSKGITLVTFPRSQFDLHRHAGL